MDSAEARQYEDEQSVDAVRRRVQDGQNVQDSRDINNRLLALRERAMQSDILNVEEQQEWQRKVNEAINDKLTPSQVAELEAEFNSQYSDIKNLVTGYTQKIMDNREVAFAVDSAKNVDDVQEWTDWFMKLPTREQQRKAYAELDNEVKIRIDLMNEIVRLRPDLEKEVRKLGRTERKDLLGQIEESENNIRVYSGLLEMNKEYFHNVQEYKDEFKDLTIQEQKRWMRLFAQVVAPRKRLVEEFNTLPKESQDSRFFKMPSDEKAEFMKNVERNIEREFDRRVDRVPSSVWSNDSKEATKKFFKQVPTLKMKVELLQKIKTKDLQKEDVARTQEYKKFRKEVRELNGYKLKDWENSTVDEKKKMLEQMKSEEILMKGYTEILDQSERNKWMSKKTKERYMKRFKNMTPQERVLEINNIKSSIKEREGLMKDFGKLSEEAQKKFKNDFYPRGHLARLAAYSKALAYDKILTAEKEAEDPTKDKPKTADQKTEIAESDEKQKIIDDLRQKAKAYEETGKIEKAVAMYEAILTIDPKNEESLKKKLQLDQELEEDEMWEEPAVIDALDEASRVSYINQELGDIELLERLYEDHEDWVRKSGGVEDITKRNRHLKDGFERDVQENLARKTGDAYIINEKGEKQEVFFVDAARFGNRREDVYNLGRRFQEMKHDENIKELSFKNEMQGRDTNLNETHDIIEKRKLEAAKEMIKGTQGKGNLKKRKGVSEHQTTQNLEDAAKKVIDKRT